MGSPISLHPFYADVPIWFQQQTILRFGTLNCFVDLHAVIPESLMLMEAPNDTDNTTFETKR